MNIQVSLSVVSGDEFIVTQSTGIWIVPSMSLHVSLYVVPQYEFLCVSLGGSRRSISRHTEHGDMDSAGGGLHRKGTYIHTHIQTDITTTRQNI